MSPAPATAPDLPAVVAQRDELTALALAHADAEREHAAAVGERMRAEEAERHARARLDTASEQMGAAFTAWRLSVVAPAEEG